MASPASKFTYGACEEDGKMEDSERQVGLNRAPSNDNCWCGIDTSREAARSPRSAHLWDVLPGKVQRGITLQALPYNNRSHRGVSKSHDLMYQE